MNRLYWIWALTAVVLGSLLGWVLASWAATPRSVEPALISPLTATAIASDNWAIQPDGSWRWDIATTAPDQVETTPMLTLHLTLVDAHTGRHVSGTVYLGNVERMDSLPEEGERGLTAVCPPATRCTLTLPATMKPLNLQAKAEGYQPYSLNFRSHIRRSQQMQITIRLVPLVGVSG
ncbi:MAG: hypothetical protein KDE56_01645 [Anaerolineales bacterium]|nr:hypothetical protein [Anaerolineales bacterium]